MGGVSGSQIAYALSVTAGTLSSFLPVSASTSVPLDNEVVMKRAPGRTIPVQGGKEGRRPEGLQVCCSETVSMPVPVCMHAYL